LSESSNVLPAATLASQSFLVSDTVTVMIRLPVGLPAVPVNWPVEVAAYPKGRSLPTLASW
jgi:hypothetical protein